MIYVITGPSGVGKGTLIKLLRERVPGLALAVSATTRPPRPGERDGVDYHFLSDAEFDVRVRAGDFVECAEYAGRRYGTLWSELSGRLDDGVSVVLEIEVQGARQIRERLPEAVLVFIAPPSLAVLRDRLARRGTDTPADVAARLATAQEELEAGAEFDVRVVNDDLASATDALVRVVHSSA